MTVCTVERLGSGSFRVSRVFDNLAAAMCAADRVLAVNDGAYVPVPQEIPLPPSAEAMIAKAENEE